MRNLTITSRKISVFLLLTNMAAALIYLSWWFDPAHIDHPVLYSALFLGEIYHIFMAMTFWQTIWPFKEKTKPRTFDERFIPSVDVFITVAGEPVELVRKTAEAVKNLDYGNYKVYLLNDGLAASKANWQEINKLANKLKIGCITRTIGGGAKAGNINNALRQTTSEIVVILDADMVVHPQFLRKIIPFFKDRKVGFVQTPQYYKNYRQNRVTQAAWQQQKFFFGPIMEGKDRQGSAIICGTNVGIRRKALEEAGGMCEDNIAEDFLTSLYIYQKGWRSHYLKEVLAEGLSPVDLLSYYNQQHRWARGSLEVLFGQNPLFKKDLSWAQKIQFISSAAFYLNGLVVFIDMLMPLIFLYTGIKPVGETTTSFILYFVPFIFLVFYTLNLVSRGSLTFKAIAFSHSSFILQLSALKDLIFGIKTSFSVTSKKALEGNFLFLAYPHLLYILLGIVGLVVAVLREGINPSVAANLSWTVFNIVMFIPFIAASFKWEQLLDVNFYIRGLVRVVAQNPVPSGAEQSYDK